MQGTPLRILLDFDRYYDDDDRVELAEEAKAEDYSLLLISMPKIDQDTELPRIGFKAHFKITTVPNGSSAV